MNIERKQTRKKCLELNCKEFLEDNVIKPDHKIDLQSNKKKDKTTKNTSKKEPKKIIKSILDYDDDDSISLYDLIPMDSDESESCEKIISNEKKDFPNPKPNDINISEKVKLPNEINFSNDHIKDNTINNNKNKKTKKNNVKPVKSVRKKFITDAQTNKKTFPLNIKSPKKEDKLIIPIFANVNKKVFKTKIEKPKNKTFINKKKKRNNELYIPLKQQLSAFKN